jgi:hypothetical protein
MQVLSHFEAISPQGRKNKSPLTASQQALKS